ncbi:ABC transporter permease [Deinococcus pimensis]|uniref:ABC transporter permease n=1 Tax=Deinococcus pimensis TaxID=309888 RepID=UPI000482FA77|nr:ABC transporter permease [Deinococcus pimensis]
MLKFIVARLAQLPLVLLALTILIVALLQLLSPQERAVAYITNDAQARNLDTVIKQRGLDQPFLTQYAVWLSGAVRGDLGVSKASGKPVMTTIQERLPATIELTLFAAVPIIGFGVWLGTLSALRRDSVIDQFVRAFAVIGFSLPTFVLGIVMLVVFYGALGWLPGSGNLEIINVLTVTAPDFHRYTGLVTLDALLNGKIDVFLDALRHLVLPAVTLVIVASASLIKVMRTQMLESLQSDYVRTARAKGLGDRAVHLKHARRNALLPVVTLSGFTVINLLSGSIITESIFGYPGIGQWAADAASRLDVPGVIGFALLSAVVVLVVGTATDILYSLVDPRVRYD